MTTIIKTNVGDYQPEDPSDLELRMARLVGLEEEPQPSEEDSAPRRQPPSEPQEPREVQTEQRLSSNPFAKLGLVGASTLAVVVFAGAFLTQMMSGGNNKSSSQNLNGVVTKTQPKPKLESRPEQLQEEIETLKTKLALADQAAAVKAAQQNLRSVKLAPPPRVAAERSPQVEPQVSARDRPIVVEQRTPTPPVRIVRVPQVVTRIVRVPQLVQRRTPTKPQIQAQQFVPPPLQPPVAPPSEPVVEVTPPPTPDPLQEWARLSKLGSYGQVSTNKDKNQGAIVAQANGFPAPQPLTVTKPPIRVVEPPSPISPVAKQNSKSTVVGSSAKAVLTTAVYGETTRENAGTRNSSNSNNSSNNNSSNKEVFKAQLKEPLKAADGSVILPKETEIFFHNETTSEQGMMRPNIFKVSWQEKNGNIIEKSVPPGNLTLRGPRSQPLVAQQHQNNNQIYNRRSRFGSDVQLGILGGLGKVGEVINRPRITCPNNRDNRDNDRYLGYYPYPCDETPDPNIAAGILEGATRTVLPAINSRISQQNTPRPAERTNIWVMPAGKEVELFVNGQMQF